MDVMQPQLNLSFHKTSEEFVSVIEAYLVTQSNGRHRKTGNDNNKLDRVVGRKKNQFTNNERCFTYIYTISQYYTSSLVRSKYMFLPNFTKIYQSFPIVGLFIAICIFLRYRRPRFYFRILPFTINKLSNSSYQFFYNFYRLRKSIFSIRYLNINTYGKLASISFHAVFRIKVAITK